MQMEYLWNLGLPAWLRAVLWPIAVGNRLAVSAELYTKILGRQTQGITEQEQIRQDSADTFPQMELFARGESMHASLCHILAAYSAYRPDMGYLPGMTYLVAQLLLHLPEYEAFQCFANLVHSYQFVAFLRADMRLIRWRLDYFNQVFKQNLSTLYEHFVALDISSDLYVSEWLLTLYARALPPAISARVWDIFLIQGEVYAYRVGLGILAMFETELLQSTFSTILQKLREMPEDLSEQAFFDCVANIRISPEVFEQCLVEHTRAELKTSILSALL